ncbi:MAG: L-aspartate oxidase [Chloroflexi bacterium]|nr:L-aspartate oxidase [Chloroflexota bacterium]
MNHYDFIVVGSGIAGLYTALQTNKHGKTIIITKGSIDDCNTKYAQGGIAAAISKKDSPELHFQDTIAAGDGLCDEEAVHILANEAPDRISDLVDIGVPFDTLDGGIALTMEAAHSVPRILHAGGDATGEHIEGTLSRKVRQAKIQILEDFLATEVLLDGGRVAGIKALDCRTGTIEEIGCQYLILATGGAGQLYKYTTNSDVATGDGVALAYNTGAEIVNMEFFQFHPTALRLPGVAPFLISEAVRGEGGILRNVNGHHFMPDYTPAGDLAPRDIVARSIIYEMKKTGSDQVFIDATHLPSKAITTRFPHIYRFCLDHGLNITKGLIPVAPAAHYMMGGIRTNTWGETNIPGLFAVGETACTGVHGANRLASNSLIEVLVFNKRIMQKITQEADNEVAASYMGVDVHHLAEPRQAPENLPAPSLSALQDLLWDNVGIIRSGENLAQAADVLAAWQECLPPPADRPSYELSNLILTGRLVTEAALIREESRGAHFRLDFSYSLPEWQRYVALMK